MSHFRIRSWGSGRAIGDFSIQGSDNGVDWDQIAAFDIDAVQFDETFVIPPFALLANIDEDDIIVGAP